MMDEFTVDNDVVKRIAIKVLEIERSEYNNPKIKKTEIVDKIKKIIEREVE